jgi:hypothetical protein
MNVNFADLKAFVAVARAEGYRGLDICCVAGGDHHRCAFVARGRQVLSMFADGDPVSRDRADFEEVSGSPIPPRKLHGSYGDPIGAPP